MSYEYLENLPPEASSRYFDKLQKVCVEKCPYKEPADKWVDNPKQWPPIQYNDLYHYLIKSPRKFFKRFLKKYHCYCLVKISTFLQGRFNTHKISSRFSGSEGKHTWAQMFIYKWGGGSNTALIDF